MCADDRCYFFGEYLGQESYKGGRTNQLIFNFKTKPTTAAADPRRAYYKVRAINTVSAVVRAVMKKHDAEHFTWVPIPTSKTPDHPDYDSRILDTLERAFRNYDVDIRSLLRQSKSTDADHESDQRLSYDELLDVIEIDPDCPTTPIPNVIVLFDDLLTTGKHFKCCEQRLREVYPDTPIIGIFAARRIFRRVEGESDLP